MLKLILLTLVTASLSCSNGQNFSTDETVTFPPSEPYSVELSVEKITANEFKLITIIKLDSISYILPISNTTMSGIFKVMINDSTMLNSDHQLIEHSCPVVTNFIWSNSPQKVIKGYVEYDQNISVLSNSDFTIHGVIQFVIEPRCTLEKIPFILSFEKGILTVSVD